VVNFPRLLPGPASNPSRLVDADAALQNEYFVPAVEKPWNRPEQALVTTGRGSVRVFDNTGRQSCYGVVQASDLVRYDASLDGVGVDALITQPHEVSVIDAAGVLRSFNYNYDGSCGG